VKAFCPAATTRLQVKRTSTWLSPTFVGAVDSVEGNAVRLKMFGPCRAFKRTSHPEPVAETTGVVSSVLTTGPTKDAYPYLDRDLMTFLYAIPPSPGSTVRGTRPRSELSRIDSRELSPSARSLDAEKIDSAHQRTRAVVSETASIEEREARTPDDPVFRGIA